MNSQFRPEELKTAIKIKSSSKFIIEGTIEDCTRYSCRVCYFITMNDPIVAFLLRYVWVGVIQALTLGEHYWSFLLIRHYELDSKSKSFGKWILFKSSKSGLYCANHVFIVK